jgi:hypothetical protein
MDAYPIIIIVESKIPMEIYNQKRQKVGFDGQT